MCIRRSTRGEIIALVVLWRLRYKLSLRDLAEMFLTRELIFAYVLTRSSCAKSMQF
jgi:transposase-like protein